MTHRERLEMAWEILKFLDIPYIETFNTSIPAIELVDILMDEEKLQILVSKLKNKVFW